MKYSGCGSEKGKSDFLFACCPWWKSMDKKINRTKQRKQKKGFWKWIMKNWFGIRRNDGREWEKNLQKKKNFNNIRMCWNSEQIIKLLLSCYALFFSKRKFPRNLLLIEPGFRENFPLFNKRDLKPIIIIIIIVVISEKRGPLKQTKLGKRRRKINLKWPCLMKNPIKQPNKQIQLEFMEYYEQNLLLLLFLFHSTTTTTTTKTTTTNYYSK